MFKEIARLNEDREEGFTLIELLVVIVIIGILISIAVVSFLNQRKKANDIAVESDTRNAVLQMKTVTMDYEFKNEQTKNMKSTQDGQNIEVTLGDDTIIQKSSDTNAMGEVPGSLTATINPTQLLASSAPNTESGTITLSPGVTMDIWGQFNKETVYININTTHDNGSKYNKSDGTYLTYNYSNSTRWDGHEGYGYRDDRVPA